MGAKQGAVGRTARRVGRSGRSAARSGWAKRLGRLGIAAKGSIYLLVAAIAIGVAAGERSDPKAQSGALATLAGGAVGKAMLIVLAVGLAGYAFWRLSVAVLGTPGPDETIEPAERIGSLALALIYGSLCAYAIGIAAGSGTPNGTSAGPDEATRTLMDRSLGTVLVLAVGALLAGLALFEGYKAASRSFMDELRTSQMSADQKRLATALGLPGTRRAPWPPRWWPPSSSRRQSSTTRARRSGSTGRWRSSPPRTRGPSCSPSWRRAWRHMGST